MTPTQLVPLLASAAVTAALVVTAYVLVRARRRHGALRDEADMLRGELALLERRDDDTGLFNSRHFVESLTGEIERSRAYGRALALALLSVEDAADLGSDGADQLKRLGAAIGGSVRALDVACRVGATEFGVVMPETDARSASVAAERVLRSVARTRAEDGSRPRAAVGIAACPAHAETFEALVERAGSALRSARRAIREEDPKPGTVPVAMAVWDESSE